MYQGSTSRLAVVRHCPLSEGKKRGGKTIKGTRFCVLSHRKGPVAQYNDDELPARSIFNASHSVVTLLFACVAQATALHIALYCIAFAQGHMATPSQGMT